jgi:RNA polymerase sigma-70 factor (ECF subfamily)
MAAELASKRAGERAGEPGKTQADRSAGFLQAALSGDHGAFGMLTEPYRRELTSHCYRMLGSLQDAEDMVQETLLRAWRGLGSYAGRATLRAWLYKIATNACLDELRRRPKRALPQALREPMIPGESPLPPVFDPIWLEPFPDEFLAPREHDPAARYESRESITLAFLSALHTLAPRQRSVLILCDVLDWQVNEVADLLDTSVSSVNSLLYRARSRMGAGYPAHTYQQIKASQVDPGTGKLLERYVEAWETADVDSLVALLTEDATFPMPPFPQWRQGRAAIRALVIHTILAGDATDRWLLKPVQANGTYGFAWYRLDEASGSYHAFAIQVLTFQGDLICDVTTFGFPNLFPRFGLPPESKP